MPSDMQKKDTNRLLVKNKNLLKFYGKYTQQSELCYSGGQ